MTTTKTPKVKLTCNECGKKRSVSVNGNYNDRCPKCGGVDWDVADVDDDGHMAQANEFFERQEARANMQALFDVR